MHDATTPLCSAAVRMHVQAAVMHSTVIRMDERTGPVYIRTDRPFNSVIRSAAEVVPVAALLYHIYAYTGKMPDNGPKLPCAGYCANAVLSAACGPMCLKSVGVELPHMEGTRPAIRMQVLYDGTLVCAQYMRRDHLTTQAALLPELAAVLELDRRKRGERRPKRLTLGRCHRLPYHFYSLDLPGEGLHFPDGELGAHLALRIWLELYDPLFPYAPLFHLLGSDPVPDRYGRVRWATHRYWSVASAFGMLHQQQEETPCGCGVRVTMRYECTGTSVEERMRHWYTNTQLQTPSNPQYT
jgi:hypothetical protein